MSALRDTGLFKRDVYCPECGAEIKIQDGAEQVCSSCSTRYSYYPEKRIVSQLVFDRHNLDSFVYELNETIVIGRDSQGFVNLHYEDFDSIREYPNIRTHNISDPHARVRVEKVSMSREVNGSKELITKLKCSLEDALSKNGTCVNDQKLKTKQTRELKNNDTIILAPNCDRYVKITYKERFAG